jgi:hypothetical protein
MNKQHPVPYIICAANYVKDGKEYLHQPKNIKSGFVICGRRHHNIIMTKKILSGNKSHEDIQGFLTSDDRFVDRIEAGEIAFKANQINKPTDCLFSEDIY